MTAVTLTHLAAQEHINDLFRDAERSRRAAGARRPRRVRRWSPRRIVRSRVRPATA